MQLLVHWDTHVTRKLGIVLTYYRELFIARDETPNHLFQEQMNEECPIFSSQAMKGWSGFQTFH